MDADRAKELLEQSRRETEAALARASGERGFPDEDQSDFSDEADDLVVEQTDEALAELLTRRLEAIERAEQRLRDGTYGRSVASGAPIPEARLEIEPWAELTVEEQSAG
jgi:DnaK suppressor protein